jgi:uncharacterized membrane protein
MSHIEKSIDLEVPVRVAYNQWTQFEEFPKFMDGVERVVQIDDRHLRWKARVMGHDVEWDAEIVEQIPDRRIRWVATSGAANSGSVDFESLGGSRSRVTLRIEVEPKGFSEKVGDAMGAVDLRVGGDLRRFKEFIEGRRQETGAWRGEIHGDVVKTGGASPDA